jgi:hypothetical protein
LEEIDGAEHEITLQSVVTHGSPVDFVVADYLNGLRVVAIEELDVVQSTVSAIDIAIDSGVAVTQSDGYLVVNPLSNKNVEAKGGFSPFHGGVAFFILPCHQLQVALAEMYQFFQALVVS